MRGPAALRSSLAPDTATRTTAVLAAPPADAERDALLAEIRKWEGEPMPEPPWLFRLVVACGTVILACAALGLIWCLAPLLIRTPL
ncbi:MAG: hypothetical protein U1E17_16205 [Geminicoccaceae bacterium]